MRERLIAELARAIHAHVCGCLMALENHDLGRHSIAAAKQVFFMPDFIKQMAQGVGYQIQPARYYVKQGAIDYYVWDRELGCCLQSTSYEIGKEWAMEECQRLADKLNKKARGEA